MPGDWCSPVVPDDGGRRNVQRVQQTDEITDQVQLAVGLDVRRSIMDAYNRLVDRSLSKSTQAANCHNYYYSASGRNVVWWPWRGSLYVLATRLCGFALFTRRASADRRTELLER